MSHPFSAIGLASISRNGPASELAPEAVEVVHLVVDERTGRRDGSVTRP
jgi:hypothetical protein